MDLLILYTSIPILNHSLNWSMPFARKVFEWTGPAHVVDKNRLDGTEASLLEKRQVIWIWAYQPECPCRTTELSNPHDLFFITT